MENFQLLAISLKFGKPGVSGRRKMGLEPKQVIPDLLIGHQVKQNKYGIGTIIACDSTWIKIKFPAKTTRFATETLEEGIITLVDEEEYLKSIKSGMVGIKLRQRKIKYFVHFTPKNNLESIITKGLLPVSKLEEKHYRYVHNDDVRMDQRCDAISLSVSFPNYRLFYVFREKHPELKWVVLLLDAEEVIKFNPAYFKHNAASAEFVGRDWSQFQGANSFEAMFGGMRSTVIPPSYPSSSQAEVMVNSEIPPKLISKILFYNEEDAIEFCEKNPWIKDKVEVNRKFFGNRIDY